MMAFLEKLAQWFLMGCMGTMGYKFALWLVRVVHP
jgi:hypothetical protein